MKRLLMPATALTTLRELAFTLLCCTLLTVSAASAQTSRPTKSGPINDPTNDGPPAGAILDLNGTPIPGGGNGTYQQYTVSFNATLSSTAITFAFRDDPAWISFAYASMVDVEYPTVNLLANGDFSGGIYTSNGNASAPVGWTYANVYGATYGGMVDGGSGGSPCNSINVAGALVAVPNCWYDGAVQAFDAISQTIATIPGHTYTISFYVAENSGCYIYPNEGDTEETPIENTPCNFSDTSTDGDTTDIGGNGIDVAVYAQSGLPPAQYTLTLTELGEGSGTVTDSSQSTCMLANGSATAATGDFTLTAGTCTSTYASGATVTLTESPTGSSTFGGWGGPCSGTGTCSFTITSSQTVTADFVSPPVTQTLNNQYCTTGSNNTASATLCPNGNYSNGVCQDPNGVVFTVEIPVVNLPAGQCFSLQATFTEVTGTGICPGSQVQYNGEGFGTQGGNTTDFDCRFVDYYNYGTTDSAGDVLTPLCYPYLNGNCVFYHLELVSGSNGGNPLTQSEIPAGVLWEVDLNPSNAQLPPIDVFTPPATYNSSPRMLDDPDYDEVTPSVPWGTSCTTPMSSETSLPSPIYCQFDNDITTSFYGMVGGDAPTETGKTKLTNDIVLAFLPLTSTGSAPTPTDVAPNIELDCATGCTPTGNLASGSTITLTEQAPAVAVVTELASPYPAPTLTISMGTPTSPNTTSVTASESGNTVTLTVNPSTSEFSSQFVAGVNIVVDGCTTAGYDGTFPIASTSGSNTLTYTSSATGLLPESDGACQATALPPGLTFDQGTGELSGTPGVGSAGTYAVAFTASNVTTTPPASGEGTSVASYMLVVSPATPTVTWPTASSLTYGQTLASSTLSGGSASVNGTFTFASPNTMPPVGASNTESVTFTPSDTTDYNTVTGTVNVAVTMATPTVITWPTASSINYGQTLASSTLSGGSASVPGSFAFTTPSTVPPVGTTPENVTFTPANSTDYTSVTGTVNVTVAQPLSVSATSLVFGSPTAPLYPAQSGIPQLLTVKNTASVSVVISSITISGTNSNDFGDLSFCTKWFTKTPGTLPAGASCVIGVDAWLVSAPPVSTTSPYTATANLAINPSVGSAINVAMKTYVIYPVASFSASGLSSSGKLTFPTTTKGSSNTVSVTVTNTGTTPLILASPAISGVSAPFSASTACSGVTIEPSGTCVFNITFAPNATGTFTETLKVTDNAKNSPQGITLSGTT